MRSPASMRPLRSPASRKLVAEASTTLQHLNLLSLSASHACLDIHRYATKRGVHERSEIRDKR